MSYSVRVSIKRCSIRCANLLLVMTGLWALELSVFSAFLASAFDWARKGSLAPGTENLKRVVSDNWGFLSAINQVTGEATWKTVLHPWNAWSPQDQIRCRLGVAIYLKYTTLPTSCVHAKLRGWCDSFRAFNLLFLFITVGTLIIFLCYLILWRPRRSCQRRAGRPDHPKDKSRAGSEKAWKPRADWISTATDA